MAGNLVSTIKEIRTLFEGLSRDVDPNDKQDNSKENARKLSYNFEEVATIMQAMESGDVEDLMREYGDIFSGRETLQKNIQDINSIIERVRTRAKQNASAKRSVEKSLTGSAKGTDFETFLSNYKEVLGQLMTAVDQKARRKAA